MKGNFVDLQDFDNFCEDLPDLPEMQTVISEARYGLELILPILEQNLKILEIGAGAGLLSGFLHKNGFEVSAIEPGGFSNFEQILDAVCIKPGLRPIKKSATDLESLKGNFDLIYSIHVSENINDLRLAV